MNLSHLTHTDINVETKVNYFVQYFQFISQKIGRIESAPLETTTSLFENIHIQLTQNLERSESYLTKYFENKLIRDHNYKTGKLLIKKFNNIVQPFHQKRNSREKKQWIQDNKSKLVELSERIINILKRNFFQENVKSMITILSCSHDLEFHKSDIILITNQIVSDFLLNDFTKDDLKSIFKFILSNKKNEFPFDKKLFFKKDKRYWDGIMEKALKNRTFKTQFQGIANFRFKQITTANFLFKIHGLYLKEDEILKLGELELISSNSKKLTQIKSKEGILTKHYFEETSEFCIAILKRKYRSENYAVQSCLEALNLLADHINRSTDYYLTINPKDLIITKNFIDFRGTTQLGKLTAPKKFNEREFRKIQTKIDGYKLEPEILEIFTKYQSIYNNANIYNRLHEYWIYLEALHKDLIDNSSSSKIINAIANTLKSNYFIRYQDRTKFSIWAGLMNNFEIYGFTNEDYNNNRFFESFNFELVKQKTKSDFLQNLIANMELDIGKLNPDNILTFYRNIFLELYELRNNYIHAGKNIRNLEIKLSYSIQHFIDIYRYRIYSLAESSKIKNPKSMYQSIKSKIERENEKYKTDHNNMYHSIG